MQRRVTFPESRSKCIVRSLLKLPRPSESAACQRRSLRTVVEFALAATLSANHGKGRAIPPCATLVAWSEPMAVANEKVVGVLGWNDLLMGQPVDEREGRQNVGDLSFMEPRQAHGGRKVDQHSGGSSDLAASERKGRGHISGNSPNDLFILRAKVNH